MKITWVFEAFIFLNSSKVTLNVSYNVKNFLLNYMMVKSVKYLLLNSTITKFTQ